MLVGSSIYNLGRRLFVCQAGRSFWSRSANNSNNAYYVTSSGGGNNNNANNNYRALPDRSYTRAIWFMPSMNTHCVTTGSRNPVHVNAEQLRVDASVACGSDAINHAPPFTFESLLKAHQKCKLGVLWKDSVAGFHLNRFIKLLNIENELINNKYKPGTCTFFNIYYPKKRTISASKYKDRIIQRSLNDNILVPQLFRSVIYDNCSCQKNKGTDFALRRFQCHLQRFYRKHGLSGYVLKCDIDSYYRSITIEVAMDSLGNIEEAYKPMLREMLVANYGIDGFSPGSQVVQTVGVMTLNKMDHVIKEKMKVKHYIRYMDDFILIANSYDQAREWKNEISKELSKIGLALHQSKTTIKHIREPIEWLGFTFDLRESGKVTYSVRSKRMKNKRKQLYRLYNKYDERFIESYKSYRAHVMRGNGKSQIRKLDSYVRSIKCRKLEQRQ